MSDELRRAGLDRLSDELYDLRCELALADIGERVLTDAQRERKRRRVAELEPLVGGHLDQLLRAEEG